MPEVSVVIPSYNHAAFIAQAIRSVLDQSLTDLELIVIDDGSTDNSLEVLAGFSDPRLKVFLQENQGAHAAINRGLGESSGAYLSILNSDDAYTLDRLEKTVRALKANMRAGLAGSYIEIVDTQNKRLGIKHGYEDCSPWSLQAPERSFRAGTDLRAALLAENYWATTSNFVFSREWYERIGQFRPLRYAHDWDFALRMALHGDLILIPEPLLQYRIHEKNTIRENQAAMIFEICWCLAVHLPQHFGDQQFFQQPVERRVSQLLHSIYTYDFDRVLSVMLVQNLHENMEQALRLLELDNPQRRTYLGFIADQLSNETSQAPASTSGSNQRNPLPLRATLAGIARRLRQKS